MTAFFAANPSATYALTYVAGTGGSIVGSATQVVTSGSSGTAVTALPDPGYHFVSWSDGNANATRTDANVKADLSVTAGFARDTIVTRIAGITISGKLKRGKKATFKVTMSPLNAVGTATITLSHWEKRRVKVGKRFKYRTTYWARATFRSGHTYKFTRTGKWKATATFAATPPYQNPASASTRSFKVK